MSGLHWQRETCVSANKWKMHNPHHIPRTSWSWKVGKHPVQLFKKEPTTTLKSKVRNKSVISTIITTSEHTGKGCYFPAWPEQRRKHPCLCIHLATQVCRATKVKKLPFYKALLMQAPWELVPALTEEPSFSWLLNRACRKEDPKLSPESYLSPHEGLVGSANDEIRPDDMQHLQGYQKPVE